MLKSSITNVCWHCSTYVGGASNGQGGAQTSGASSQASPPQVEDKPPETTIQPGRQTKLQTCPYPAPVQTEPPIWVAPTAVRGGQ